MKVDVKRFIGKDIQMAKLGCCSWHVPRLIDLSREFEVMDIPLSHLNVYYTYEKLTLRELAGHMVAVSEADLQYPIILDEDGDIMDGRHRVMKAMINGNETIKAVRFKENPNPCERDQSND